VLLSKIREALLGIRAGRVTLPYPFAPHPPEAGFRGKLEVDKERCFGCGGCANVCPARVIELRDLDQHTRLLELHWRRCTYCGRCEEVCPEQAIRLGQEFETVTDAGDDMVIRLEVFMGPCQRCGRCFPPPTPLDRLMETGFRGNGKGGHP
jgi:hydrogenase-4 component H